MSMKKTLLSLLTLLLVSFAGSAVTVDLSFEAMGTQAQGWSNSYAFHEYNASGCTVKFSEASKQTSYVTDVPVQKKGDVTITLTDANFETVTFNFKQWGTKTQVANLSYSTDGTNFKAFSPAISATLKSGSLSLSASTIPANVVAIKMSTTQTNQIGVASIEYTANAATGPKDFNCADFKDYTLFEGRTATITLPEGAPEVKYSTSDENIAVVENGTIIAVAPGTAVITASWDPVTDKWNAGNVPFTVTVKAIPDGVYIEFKDNTKDSGNELTNDTFADAIETGAEFISTISDVAKVYAGKYGIKFSTSSVDGKITFNLATAVNCTKIIVLAQSYNDKAASLSVNGSEAQSMEEAAKEFIFDGGSEISAISLAATGRLYVKSILLEPVVEPAIVAPVEIKTLAVDLNTGELSIGYTLSVKNIDAEPVFAVTLTNATTLEEIPVTVKVVPSENTAAYAASDVKNYSGYVVATSEAIKTPDLHYNVTLSATVGDLVSEAKFEDGNTSGVENITVEAAAAEYYDLTGRKVANPAAGTYIRVAAGKATKVIIR